jgi:phosphoadenosine phosphosulfate reductase
MEWDHRLGWLREPSVPLLGCPRGRSSACWRMRGDYWLAGRYEKKVLEAVFERALGARPSLVERLVVFHRAPAPLGEYAAEVFADALRLGVLEYAPGRGWLLHPSGAAGSLAAGLGAPVARVSFPPGRRVKGKRLRVPCRGGGGRGFLLLGDGRWVAVARSLGGCEAKVKDVAPLGFRQLPPAGLDEAVEANREALGALAAEARAWIRRVYDRVMGGRGRVYVALSGGADSSAVLSLAREALGAERLTAVYADTGMEFPETRRHVERLASLLGVDLEVVESDVDPLEEARRRGLMTREDRWCTRLLKLEPLRRFYRRVGARLVLDGARALESTGRAATPRLGENPLIPGVKRALPIHHWSRLMVQLYLAERNIPVLHLYQEGLTRIGCIACPAMHLYELHIAYRLHPWWFRRLAAAAGPDEKQGLARLLRGEWRRGDAAGAGRRRAEGEAGPG